jgi:hypothetical protein
MAIGWWYGDETKLNRTLFACAVAGFLIEQFNVYIHAITPEFLFPNSFVGRELDLPPAVDWGLAIWSGVFGGAVLAWFGGVIAMLAPLVAEDIRNTSRRPG